METCTDTFCMTKKMIRPFRAVLPLARSPPARSVYTKTSLGARLREAARNARASARVNRVRQESALRHGHAVRNTGSTARDHLANERTFLAYSRTGLAFMGAGVGLFSAFQIMDEAHETEALRVLPASGLLVLNGVLFLTFATRRFYFVQRKLLEEQFPVIGRKLISLLAATSLSTVAALFVVADPTGIADWRPDDWKSVAATREAVARAEKKERAFLGRVMGNGGGEKEQQHEKKKG